MGGTRDGHENGNVAVREVMQVFMMVEVVEVVRW